MEGTNASNLTLHRATEAKQNAMDVDIMLIEYIRLVQDLSRFIILPPTTEPLEQNR